jgi:hypothetical protein
VTISTPVSQIKGAGSTTPSRWDWWPIGVFTAFAAVNVLDRHGRDYHSA